MQAILFSEKFKVQGLVNKEYAPRTMKKSRHFSCFPGKAHAQLA